MSTPQHPSPLASFNLALVNPSQTDSSPPFFLPANSPTIAYDGRIDFADPLAPVIVWQGTTIRLAFTGDSLSVRFDKLEGQVYFDATIGTATVRIKAENGLVPIPLPASSSPAPHEITLFKRSEAAAGTVAFLGFELAPDARVVAPAPIAYDRSFLFYGDSITAGACNEDPAEDQWEDRSTHNNALSFAAITARACNARYRNIAVSGMGVANGWSQPNFTEVWNRLHPRADAPLADLAEYQPDVLCINLGENDDSYTQANELPFPADFAPRFLALLRAMRTAYPNARIVVLRGGMTGGAQSEHLRQAWEQVVATLEAEDPKLSHFVFRHWSANHPRVPDAQAMADELAPWLLALP